MESGWLRDARSTTYPSWCKKGTRASYGYATLRETPIGGWTRLNRALVTEVSVLPPGVEPREPRAQVLLLERAPTAVTTSDRAAVGEPVMSGMIRRQLGQVLAVDGVPVK